MIKKFSLFILSLSLIAIFQVNLFAVKDVTFGELILDGPITEVPVNVNVFTGETNLTIYKIVSLINKAAEDNELEGIIIRIKAPEFGFAQAEDINRALKALKEKGKKVYVYSYALTLGEYLLIAQADKIFIHPAGGIETLGLGMAASFYRGFLDWIGAVPNFYGKGDYKSAIESYNNSESSKYFKEAYNELLDDYYDYIVNMFSDSRGISKEEVKNIIDTGFYLPEEAKQKGLINDICYETDLNSNIALGISDSEQIMVNVIENYGVQVDDSMQNLDAMSIMKMFSPAPEEESKDPKIAVVFLDGTIIVGISGNDSFGSTYIGSDDIVALLDKFQEDDTIKAVVLRINSPGGSSLASDIIWNKIERLKKYKPIVVSMANMAASGGYYISMAGSYIFAHPTTITGSIGVYSGKINLAGVYEKLGINVEIFSRGKNATMYSSYNDFSESELEILMKQLDFIYDSFVTKAADNRNMTYDELDKVAQGRIWTGTQALKNKLVDELGGLEDAINKAKELSGYQDKDIMLDMYPKPKSLIDVLAEMFGMTKTQISYIGMLPKDLQETLLYFKKIEHLLSSEKVLTLLPYDYNFKFEIK